MSSHGPLMKTSRGSRDTGLQAEQQALLFLQSRGLRRVASNFTVRGGEIDLVMQDRDILVFVEVRYRRQSSFGSAAESVTGSKQRRIIRAAGIFLSRNSRWQDTPCRFDVLAISGDKKRDIAWIQDAFRSG